MSLKRRDFIKIISGSALTLPLLECSTKGYFSTIRKNQWAPGVEEWVQSVCGACPGGCGILVRVVDGKAVKIEGNPAHPVNKGRLCPLGQAGTQMLYNPDRIKGPMKKVGGRTSTQWAEISWEEALEILVSRLNKLKTAGEAHKFVLLTEESRGMSHELFARFMNAFGSPNHISNVSNASLVQAFNSLQGINQPMAYDFENSNYILSFGADILTSWPSPVQSMRAFSYLRQGRPGIKAKIIQVEPRFSITASRSDKWVPIKPGTEGLLALGLAYVIIKENLYERNYIENFTFGFDPWIDERGETHKGFGNLILNNYRLDFVSEATGVAVDTIVTLAKEFAGNKPAVAVADQNSTDYSNGLYNALAIHSLNALAGTIDVPGGVLVKRDVPLQELPVLALDQAAKKSLSQPRIDSAENNQYPLAAAVPSLIPENILKGKPYPIDLLFLFKSNPLFSAPNGEAFQKAFEKIPFIISFSSFMDESALFADLVLPDKTYLEKHQYVESSPLSKIPVLGIGKPAVENLYNTRATEDVFLDLAQRMGEVFAAHFPWKNSQEFLLYKIDSLFQARKGIIFTDAFEESQLKLLEERGWWVPQFSSASEFKDELINKGGWWDPYYDFGVKSLSFKTPSGKFEFYSQIFAAKIAELPGRPPGDPKKAIPQTMEAKGDEIYLPHYEEPRFSGDEKEYPLYLHIHQPLSLSHSYSADQPWFQEIMGFHLNMNWDSWAEINPRTAEELGIRDHDAIWIESVHGKVRVIAKTYPGAMPGVVSLPLGLGHKTLGQWARNRGVNPMELIGTILDEWTGQVLKSSARIKVYKA
jgi:anaerobic selenocysteine-containing dehydrogenase